MNIICSFIIEKFVNHFNHYESLFQKKPKIIKISKSHKPKINKFVNYNTYKYMKN
jgi:hypothetical protein